MLHLFYRIPIIRERICRIRFLFLSKRRNLVVANTNNVLHEEYSSEHFGKYTSHKNRINFLIDLVKNNFELKESSRVLSVGPRFESELFGLRGLGFKWSQIQAIDTYSYSPYIDSGNMHKLSHNNSSFNLIIAGCVIAYSKKPLRAIQEFYRVLKPNGILILTWEFPGGYEFKSFQDFSLYRQKIIGNFGSILKPLYIFDLTVKTFEIQSLICSSLNTNSTSEIALVLRKG